jgi:hypothetical protein
VDSSLDPMFLFLECLTSVQPMIDYLNENVSQGGLFSRPDVSFVTMSCFCSAHDRLSEREGDSWWTLFST